MNWSVSQQLNMCPKCANPLCWRTARLHVHHIVPRSEGGKTVIGNELALCDVCHALSHIGALIIEGDPSTPTGIAWRRRSDDLIFDLGKDIEAIISVPDMKISEHPAAGESNESKSAPPLELQGALVNLGVPKKRAEEQIRRAWEELCKVTDHPTEQQVLRHVLSGAH